MSLIVLFVTSLLAVSNETIKPRNLRRIPMTAEGCPPGSYTSYGISGNMYCRRCPSGKYNMNKNNKICYDCEKGKYYDENGGTECKSCIPGKFNNEESSIKCISCTNGKYSTKYNSTKCSGQSCSNGENSLQECTNIKCAKCKKCEIYPSIISSIGYGLSFLILLIKIIIQVKKTKLVKFFCFFLISVFTLALWFFFGSQAFTIMCYHVRPALIYNPGLHTLNCGYALFAIVCLYLIKCIYVELSKKKN